ncbi:MAG TPA: glycosyltransferase family 39 protein [Gemmatimonadaceae bacterium]|jgi:4-amino-4-deoxy-L-arabinose transferase-like glycosyltransferase
MTVSSPAHRAATAEWTRALQLLAAGTVLRLLMAALVPLTNDEAYYWEWSRRLAAGYFDHPPAIAWLVALGGDSPLGVRVGSVLAGTLAGLAVLRTARRLGGDAAALWASLIFACLPLAAAGYVLATPDAPLFCALAWTLHAVVEALEAPAASRAALRWWSVAGVAIGVAMLSKYTAVLVPAAIALSCALYAPLRARFREPGPYVAVAIASVVLAPNLWWNATHEWTSFAFQFGHGLGAPKATGLGAVVTRELNLIGGQAGLTSPILFVLLVGAVWRAVRQRDDAVLRLLASVSVFVLLFFAWSATRKNVEANWPASAWLPAIILVALEAAHGVRRGWLRGGLWLGAALVVLVYVDAATLLAPRLGLRPGRDPISQAYGWDAVAGGVGEAVRIAQSARRGEPMPRHVWVAADRYQQAAQLAWGLRQSGRDSIGVFSTNLAGRANQYDLWWGFRERASPGDALVLVLDEAAPEAAAAEPAPIVALAPYFSRVDQGPPVVRSAHGLLLGRQRAWLLRDWRGGWPGHSTPSIPESR